ncbi:MAG TPA: alpha/beta hydrolase [Wenzhouxiangellaceae bacterium]|nr:alpha/beta hydrolase [Wenzhouxiangellaceae bacterium]
MTLKLSSITAAMLLSVSLEAQQPVDRWPADTEKCELSAAGGRISVSALCGTLDAPEDRSDGLHHREDNREDKREDKRDGRTIELAWAVVEARTGDPAPDPVFFLAGGPGQSARDVAPVISNALSDINRNRDLIFLDQRGTGGSNALECEFDEDTFLVEPDLDQINELLRQCHETLDADVRHYTTVDGAEDLELLRRHLGLDTINLVGGSYGTRMAQVYLRRFPEAVRAMIIDGVVPTRLKLGSEHAEMLDRSIEKLLQRCVGDATCSERFPELNQAFDDLKARYAETPQDIQVTHPRTGVAEELTFSDAVLASSLRFLAYSPVSQMMIPYLIHEAATTGSPERLAAQALMTNDQMSQGMAIGLNFSVGCSEDWPYWPADSDASGTLLGNSFTELYSKVCSWWPADPVGPDYHQPFDVDVPILILSGELDPVTPPQYGEEANEQFSNSLHIVSEGRGHITITNPCISSIATEFIAEAGVEDLDTECTDRIGPEPFFINLLGPTP